MRTIPKIRPPENKFLLCLQYWKGDRDQAMQLARFIADLHPGRCDAADFLFISRFDCPHDAETIKHVGKKFNVYSYISRRQGTGWPMGCNDLWFQSISWVHHMREARKIPAYKMVFTFEADGVPLSPNWILEFSRAWDVESAKHLTYVMGAYLTAPGPHINGNAMFSCDPRFTYWLTKQVGGVNVNAGWDYVLYPDFRKWGAHDYPPLRSYWNSHGFKEEAFNQEVGRGTVFIHGCKDNSLLEHARRRFLRK